MEKALKEFKKYYNTFDTSNSNIIRKYYHSIRVMNLSKLIAKYAEFNDNDAEIATLVGLLHDYGRFPQWTKYNTYWDKISVDHADLGVELLMENMDIEKYTNAKENYDEIYDAIKNHNKYKIKPKLSDHNKKLCQVIRDADKLDIYFLISIRNIPNDIYSIDDKPISKKIIEDFNNEKCISAKDVNTKKEEILLNLAMVFDLNYYYSFKHMKDYDLVNKFYNAIDGKEELKSYFDKVNNFIERKLNNVR